MRQIMSCAIFAIIALICSSSFGAEIGVAQLAGTSSDPTISGHVYFVTVNDSYVWVWANVKGITNNLDNLHGMHVHQLGDITSPVAASVASHYFGVLNVDVHRCEDSLIRHEGDMGNWNVSSEGTVFQEKYLDLLSLSGNFSIIGRGVILHNFTDDCNTTASSQARLAQGVIGIANPNNLPPIVAAFVNSTNPTNSASAGSPALLTTAIVTLSPINSGISGVVTFYQNGTGLSVKAELLGLKSTNGYGFHIHLFGDLNSPDGSAGGRHFNSSYDLGNICTFGSDGKAYYNYHFDGLLFDEGLATIVGRSVIVHALWDPLGIDEGVLIAQGVVGIGNNASFVSFPEGITFNPPDCQYFAPETKVAVARLLGGENDETIIGSVYFATLNATHTIVWANVSGITNNPDELHGMHVHLLGDVASLKGTFVEGHYIGSGADIHSCEPANPRHEGDMGNWKVTGGVMLQSKVLDLLALDGPFSIIGRAVVLHNQTDNCLNISSAGSRLAQGVIGIANPGLQTIPHEISSFFGLSATSSSNNATAGPGASKAIAVITSTSSSNVSGIVTFEQQDAEVTILAKVFGLNSTEAYGFHLHIFGDMSLNDGTSASSHYNPFNSSHSLPPQGHVGDLGNICTFGNDGTAYYRFIFSSSINLTGPYSILGRSVIIHSIRDDGGTNYGSRIGQGVIGLGSSYTNITIPSNIRPNSPLCPPPPPPSPSPSPTPSSPPSLSTSGTSSPVPTTAPTPGHHGISEGAKAIIAIIVIAFVTGMIAVFLYYNKKDKVLTFWSKLNLAQSKKPKTKKERSPSFNHDYVAFEDNDTSNF